MALSFNQAELTANITGLGVLRMLEAIRMVGGAREQPDPLLPGVSRSEMFGKVRETPQTELTPFHPRSPYGCAKVFGRGMLALAALAEGREVLVSRGELIEIGDGFRIPDVLDRSGARLRRGRHDEPHTRGRLREARSGRTPPCSCASTSRTSASSASPSSLAARARRDRRAVTICRCRRSRLRRAHATPRRADRARSLAAGADLVCFSGDKLLGGPQAGIVVGRADLVEKLRRHPLQRALRADKLTLAALEGTLTLDSTRRCEIPVLRMLREPVESVRARAERLAAAVGRRGRGDRRARRRRRAAAAELPSFACAVEEALAEKLRAGRATGDRDRPRRTHPARLPHADRRGG